MKALPLTIPVEYIRECFSYDPISGDLFWVERPRSHFRSDATWVNFNTNFAGTVAGSKKYCTDGVTPGCITVSLTFKGKPFRTGAHRLIYAIMGITVPVGLEVDHKDCDPWNNAWLNLRLGTHSQNGANRKKNRGRKHNFPKGVYPAKGKFRAIVTSQDTRYDLGYFSTAEEAHAAYCAKATELSKNFARFN